MNESNNNNKPEIEPTKALSPVEERKRRLEYLVRFAKGFKSTIGVITVAVRVEAIRKFGVTKRTALDYTESVLQVINPEDPNSFSGPSDPEVVSNDSKKD